MGVASIGRVTTLELYLLHKNKAPGAVVICQVPSVHYFLFPLHGCYRQALPDQPDLLLLPVTHCPVEMAKKSSSRKSLKSLFSRSEAKLDESVEKDADKNGGEKKRFKFLKFKIKSKGGSASEKSTNERQQVSR